METADKALRVNSHGASYTSGQALLPHERQHILELARGDERPPRPDAASPGASVTPSLALCATHGRSTVALARGRWWQITGASGS